MSSHRCSYRCSYLGAANNGLQASREPGNQYTCSPGGWKSAGIADSRGSPVRTSADGCGRNGKSYADTVPKFGGFGALKSDGARRVGACAGAGKPGRGKRIGKLHGRGLNEKKSVNNTVVDQLQSTTDNKEVFKTEVQQKITTNRIKTAHSKANRLVKAIVSEHAAGNSPPLLSNQRRRDLQRH